jgi:hypothetical protein
MPAKVGSLRVRWSGSLYALFVASITAVGATAGAQVIDPMDHLGPRRFYLNEHHPLLVTEHFGVTGGELELNEGARLAVILRATDGDAPLWLRFHALDGDAPLQELFGTSGQVEGELFAGPAGRYRLEVGSETLPRDAVLWITCLGRDCTVHRQPGELCESEVDGFCDGGLFCDVAGHCGDRGAVGICMHRPLRCKPIPLEVCGCDGREYVNTCVANRFGVSVRTPGGCQP